MKALVTGASGFIGSTLIEELSSLGFDVYALMRSSSSAANLSGLKFQRLEGDLSDEESLLKALRRVPDLDFVFHLAGATTGPNRDYYFEHNGRGTARLARAVAAVNAERTSNAERAPGGSSSHAERASTVGSGPKGLTRFVHVSSLAAAGPANSMDPRKESEANHPVSAYGESKLQGEKEVLQYKDSYPVTIIRPPMVYGPKDKGVFVVIKTVSKNLMPLMPGSGPGGHKYYSAIHCRDLCRGIIQAAQAKNVQSGEIFYLSGDGVFSYQELLSTMAEKLGRKPIKFKIPSAAIFVGAAAGSALGVLSKKAFALNLDKLNELRPDYWICSNEKAKKVFNFSPEYSLGLGMADTIDWYKRQKWI
jgi:dihydroflavonol-4-reductase